MNEDVDNTSGSGNYIEMCPPETTMYRYLTTVLHLVLLGSILGLVSMGLYFFLTPCEECDYYNRVLAIAIWVKTICHVHLTIVRIKKREAIENNEGLKSLVIYLIKIFNSLTLLLVLSCLHLLHFYKNKCSFSTVALKFIKIYYYVTITLYFVPLLFYICLGLFLSIIICVIVNLSVDENDRIPTPENIISKLTVLKYSDIDFVLIFHKVKRVMQRKDNREEKEKKKKKLRDGLGVTNASLHGDDQVGEVLNPLKGSNESNDHYDLFVNRGETPGEVPFPGSEEPSNGLDSSHHGGDNDHVEGYGDGCGDDEEICSICMMNYVRSDDVMMMPCDKRHFFHVGCLTKWLYKSQACPICRTNIVSCLNAQGEVV
ncbi:hypothetical protein AK88_01429 [Plasmodium fragile]|uniref:RING-type E3 ubiquitin transferase n=1 Tax=Plasmodium fragile TaxID=5857 RepID=A0A0D9QPA6_PLAFR|nr:uncharacterized protein AK88_01429 [Plasmodium fragile]KJP88935.1 hypothetical protein AK88_01429 [Plasmodium fragile]